MADAYPSIGYNYGQSQRLRHGIERRDAQNGAARGIVWYPASKGDFDIEHPGCTAAELTTLQNFFNTHKGAQADFTFADGTVTTVILVDFQKAPMPGNRWNVRVTMAGA